jgi:hypothetical protein
MCSALSLAHDVIAGYPPPNMNTSPTHSPVAAKVPLSLWRLMEFKGYDRRMREMVSSNSLGKKRCRLDDDNNYCSESLCTLPFISQPPPTLPLVQTTKGGTDPNFPIDVVEELYPMEQEIASKRVAAGYEFEESFVLDYDRSNLDNRHVIHFDELINFIDSNFLCK